MVKNGIQMALGGAIIAAVLFVNSKFTKKTYENKMIESMKPYVVPVACVVVALLIMFFIKNELAKLAATWFGAAGIAGLINNLFIK